MAIKQLKRLLKEKTMIKFLGVLATRISLTAVAGLFAICLQAQSASGQG